MTQKINLTYYSDVLCIWAYISQARVDEALANFAGQLELEYRFCSVFGDVEHKIQSGWSQRGGYQGYAQHVQSVASGFSHIDVNPACWQDCRPLSSAPAHLLLKAVQRVAPQQCCQVLHAIRTRFFSDAEDISSRSVLNQVLAETGVSLSDVDAVMASGQAFADLEADRRDQQSLLVQGSPSILLNEGRQKLYGNVGYRVIEANINELLSSRASGAGSWC